MRELTKSMFSFTWAMPLYGVKQILNLSFPRDMSRPFGEAADGFGAVTDAMRKQLGPTVRSLFEAGDQIQRGLVDAAFSLGLGAFDPNAMMRMGQGLQRGMAGMPGMAGMQGGGPTGSAGQRAADYASSAADLGVRSMEQGARAATEAAYATAAAVGYQPSGGATSNRNR